MNALAPFHPTLRDAPKDLPFLFDFKTLETGLNFTFSTDVGDIDLFGELTGVGDFEEVFKLSEKVSLFYRQSSVKASRG